ncbi:MAG: VCBS repeat-containing protein [Verrucomicrobiales bacterium]|nr:VCBS repeat-containing protein [Verrucomicrobiales bacterium]MCP5526386.1 VCBS repeat-containing protein [Verrucomicrobiales bacterium]
MTLVGVFAGYRAPAAAPATRLFTDATAQSGIEFHHEKVRLDDRISRIMPWMASIGAAAAACDYDQDGHLDVFLTSSALGSTNRLFRNRGDGSFEDVAEQVGLAAGNVDGASIDAVWADYDNDGRRDLYLVRWGANVLYHNEGNGTFREVTSVAGVGDTGNGTCAVWFDYNDDHQLDLYVGNYFRRVDLFALEDTRIMHEDFETARDGGDNVLYRNNGDGTFTDVSQELGVADTGWTLDVGAADYDNDGDQDLFVANDFGQDRLFRLNADATFTDVTDTALGWDTYKGMNIDLGDFNNDGWLDLYICNIYAKEYVKEGNRLHRNMGDGTFSDISFEAGVYDAGWAWAGRFWDYDNDGYLDLMVANGYISGDPDDEYFAKLAVAVTKPGFDPTDAMNWPVMGNATFSGYEPNRVFHNLGNESFSEVAGDLGLGDRRDARGLAIADYDNDGDLDVYVSNQGQDGAFYRNDLASGAAWIELDLAGTNCNRDAIGTRITVQCGDRKYIREVNGGNGDHSQTPFRQHFGLADATEVDRLEVRWPTGWTEVHERVAVNQILRLVERTPPDALAERRQWKEAQLEARRLEAEREEQLARAASTDRADGETADWGKLAAFKREYVQRKAAVEKDPRNPRLRFEFAVLLDRQDRHSAALGELEQAIRLDPDQLLYANTYRNYVRRYGHLYFDRSIRFFEDLAEEQPDRLMPALNQALAYVDKMPYPKLGIVAQGRLSNKSITTLDAILRREPDCWAARFVVAMNHLHWPRKLNHAPLASEAFSQLIALQNTFPKDLQRSHFALAYVGLGDAHIQNLDRGRDECLARAGEAWRQGLERYPDSPELRKRVELLANSPDALIDFVTELRSLKNPVDTDLNQIWVDQ